MTERPMNLERAKELLALRLYDELTPAENEALERFLAASPGARIFAIELAEGLGRLEFAVEREAAAEMPADWSERLRAATRTRPARHAILRTLGTFAAGLAAGLLLTWIGGAEPGAGPPRVHRGSAILADEGPEFTPLSGPPPRATGGEALARR